VKSSPAYSRENSSTHHANEGAESWSSASDASMRALLDNAPDAVSRFDRQLRHVYANLATARANNRPVEDFYLKTMRDLGHSEQIASLLERHLLEVFTTGKEQTFDVDFAGPHGRRYFQTRMAPEFFHGEVESVVVFSRDLTDLKNAQEQLVLSEKHAAASRLAHELAHELNNPLAGLTFIVHLLKTRTELDSPEMNTLLASASQLVERISTSVQSVLAVTNTEGQ
jgi:nitrogen-specific signal transduction histidine kinase